MLPAGKTLKLCSCNGTIPLDGERLARALGRESIPKVHRELCRKEAGLYTAALAEPDLVVGCTQEAALFAELAQEAKSAARLSFVNLREYAGWSVEGRAATPKMAALVALAALPEPEPVPAVQYRSQGALLVIGPAEAALDWAERLSAQLQVSVLLTSAGRGELPAERRYPIRSGRVTSLKGWLGAFEVEWQQENPIDLDLCTRCNGCVRACPEGAIDFTYQIDLSKCRAHRACVKACGAVGAIDFARPETVRRERYDLVLDLSRAPILSRYDPPQGYCAPGADPLEQALGVQRLLALVGEFEKPRFTAYRERICAHARSGVTGCTRCLDICSTGAIREQGDHVEVEAHLCAGCGGCATVCPSGAMAYAYPAISDLGGRLKVLLGAYRKAGGEAACVLVHDAEEGRRAVLALGRGRRGLPARVLPLECFRVAAFGIDLALAAIAYGAVQVRVLVTEGVGAGYREALRAQFSIAQTILSALGYGDGHLGLVEADALEESLWSLPSARGVAQPATFAMPAEKRAALEFAIEHLAAQAPSPLEVVALPAGAPFGAIVVDKSSCTLCKACIGACPVSAIVDTPEAPKLRFVERNCVQCGLCARTCPERAISLVPRLSLAAQAKEAVTLNEVEPFHCVRCGKPFGTRPMIEAMLTKVAGHAMFATGQALARLRMCADCRVIDMMESKDETTIFDYTGRQ